MLTKLTIRNFKRFTEAEIELGNPVVFIGPNNSGKTTALQALALWDAGVKRWIQKRGGKKRPKERPGVAINRKDLSSIPNPSAKLLWKDLHVRDVKRPSGKTVTKNIRMEITVECVSDGKFWECGMEFDYANEESFYCKPIPAPGKGEGDIPDGAAGLKICFLPPMSGLASIEEKLDPEVIARRIGEGRTAEVLRNLCFLAFTGNDGRRKWEDLCKQIEHLFGVSIDEPVNDEGQIKMTYRERQGVHLDLSSAGRGLQQTLLLLAYISINPGSVLMIDEPDAHLEILRQRQIYEILCESALKANCQILVASHSEVFLNEAAGRNVVVAFVGKPHRIDDRGSQLLKSLREIGFDQYLQAEQKGWALYLEGSTDLAILRSFASRLGHRASEALERPFVRYVMNQPVNARSHFNGLKEAKPDFIGFALFDRLDSALMDGADLVEMMWKRKEIENYLCSPAALLSYAEATVSLGPEPAPGPLFAPAESDKRKQVMDEMIRDLLAPAALRKPSDPWWKDAKVRDEFLERVFDGFFEKLGLPNMMKKSNYHELARHVPIGDLDSEIAAVLDAILDVSDRANPVI